jgi:hypothetical protein
MGPYYRATSQSTGAFFESIYDNPIIALVIVAGLVGVVVYWMNKKKSGEN